MIIPDKKNTNVLIFLLTLMYAASYLCRYSYSTVLPEMIAATGRSKAELSVAVTCLFISYGIGQIFSGFLGDRLPKKALIAAGGLISSVINLILPFVTGLTAVRVIWCVNGLAQSLFWPPIAGLMINTFSKKSYSRACAYVASGGFIGTIALFLAAPLLIKLQSYKLVFVFGGVFTGLITVVFAILFPGERILAAHRLDNEEETAGTGAPESSGTKDRAFVQTDGTTERPEKTADPAPVAKAAGIIIPLAVVLFCVMIQGFIRDGVSTWMPTYVSEMFDLGSKISILSGVILPLFAIICIKLSQKLYDKWLTNPLDCSAFLAGLGAVFALALWALKSSAAPLTLLFSALLTGCMHGVNLMLIGIVPALFRNTGKVSAVSGLLNAATYAGSAVSAYAIAAIAEKFEWNNTFAILAAFSLLAAVLCFLNRKFGKTEK